MPESGILGHIASAEVAVRKAREAWDPSSLPGCLECSEHLDQAIGQMQFACEATAAGPVPPDTKARLNQLRSEVESLSRLVGAATAFSRGLALRASEETMIVSDLKG